jgi:hypothetical protein
MVLDNVYLLSSLLEVGCDGGLDAGHENLRCPQPRLLPTGLRTRVRHRPMVSGTCQIRQLSNKETENKAMVFSTCQIRQLSNKETENKAMVSSTCQIRQLSNKETENKAMVSGTCQIRSQKIKPWSPAPDKLRVRK